MPTWERLGPDAEGKLDPFETQPRYCSTEEASLSGLQKVSAQAAGTRGAQGRPPGSSSSEDGDRQQDSHTQTATRRQTCRGDNQAWEGQRMHAILAVNPGLRVTGRDPLGWPGGHPEDRLC